MENATLTMCSSEHELDCEVQLANLLEELTDLQKQVLGVLGEKRRYMAAADREGMIKLQAREQELCEALQQCHDRRAVLLKEASEHGWAVDSLSDLATMLQERGRRDLRKTVKTASTRMRLLQHNCLTNWVLAQKALLHASQMLEIIATGGRLQPTYGDHTGRTAGGALVDQEV